MAKRKTPQEELLALFEKVQQQAKPAPAPAQPKVKARDISKAVAMIEKGQKLIAEGMALLSNDNTEKSEDYLANEAMFPEVPGAFFGRKANGQPKAPSGKQATEANKAAFAKAYPSLAPGFELNQEFVNSAIKSRSSKGGGGVKNG